MKRLSIALLLFISVLILSCSEKVTYGTVTIADTTYTETLTINDTLVNQDPIFTIAQTIIEITIDSSITQKMKKESGQTVEILSTDTIVDTILIDTTLLDTIGLKVEVLFDSTWDQSTNTGFVLESTTEGKLVDSTNIAMTIDSSITYYETSKNQLITSQVYDTVSDTTKVVYFDDTIFVKAPLDSTILSDITLEPLYKYSWHLAYTDGSFQQSEGWQSDAHINIETAWAKTKGAGVKVAIIDDSFETDHIDFEGRIIYTINAATGLSDVEPGSYHSHGTTCAGYVGATQNGYGMVGVAPEASLILIKEDTYSDANIVRAFDYAKAQGAQVISCSWGTYQVSQSVNSKIKELYDAGIVILFANGNDALDLDISGYDDESELPTVIGVGASSEKNDITSYSNYGSEIEFLAPGGDYTGILGLDNMGSEGSYNQQGVVSNNYNFGFGTSYSCPVAAGVVALMLSVNPNLTPDQVRSALISTAQKVGGSSANYVNGFDTKRAYGKIDAGAAVNAIE